MHNFNRIRQVAPICTYWTIHLQRRSALCEITFTTCYLWTRPLRQWHR